MENESMSGISSLVVILAVAFLLAAGGGSAYYVSSQDTREINDKKEDAPQQREEKESEQDEYVVVNTDAWETYINEEMKFSIDHPSDWVVHEDESPAVSFYVPEGAEVPQFSIPNDVNRVTVSPRGSDVSGIIGNRTSTRVDMSVDTISGTDILTADGIPWVTYIRMQDPPDGWHADGYIAAFTKIDGREKVCMTGDGISSEWDECEGSIVYDGSVDRDALAIQEKMLSSFEFVDDGMDEVVAIVDSTPIFRKDLEARMKVYGGMEDEGFMRDTLDQMIDERLLLLDAKVKGYEVDSEAVSKEYDSLFLDENLEDAGFSKETLMKEIEKKMMFELYLDDIPQESELEVSESEAMKRYEELIEEGSDPPSFEEVRDNIEYILMSEKVSSEMEVVLEELRGSLTVEILI